MAMTAEEYKSMSIKEFSKAAQIYDSGHSGIYEMCKYDYPKIIDELKKMDFNDVLDCGCGTGPMVEIMQENYPDKKFTGLDLTPQMIAKAKEKNILNALSCGSGEELIFSMRSILILSRSIKILVCHYRRR